MKTLIAATALAIAVAAPAFAPGQQALAQTYSKEQTTTHKVAPHKVKKANSVAIEERVLRRVGRRLRLLTWLTRDASETGAAFGLLKCHATGEDFGNQHTRLCWPGLRCNHIAVIAALSC